MIWVAAVILAIFILFMALAITHVGAEADRKYQEIFDQHIKAQQRIDGVAS